VKACVQKQKLLKEAEKEEKLNTIISNTEPKLLIFGKKALKGRTVGRGK
jgi:hypothetical protein